MTVLGILVFWGVVMFVAFEIPRYFVYGKLLPDREIEVYLTKYIDQLEANPYSSTLLHVRYDIPENDRGDLPFISKSWGILSSWYIQDHGTIPRWSVWNKRLDAKLAALKPAVPPKKSLKEL